MVDKTRVLVACGQGLVELVKVKPEGKRAMTAAEWAQGRGCAWLKIETQNVNVAACRFYRKMGCTLGAVDRFAYPELPGEVRLLWWKPVAPHRESRTTESAN